MKTIFTRALGAVVTALAVAVASPAFADDVGYLTTTEGQPVKSGFDLCWNAGDTTTPEALAECEGEPAPEPPKDSDGDGVVDSEDACPNTPAGVEVDSRGCPLDSDGDGVPDYLDRCPNTPQGTEVDEHGCPVVGTVLDTIEGVHFAFDKAALRPSAEQQLQQAIQKLQDNPGVSVGVVGHTDSVGSEAYNMDLSMRRAQSVLDYLTAHGIDASRLQVDARGENDPIATNETKAGRAQNRRVELVVSE